MCHGEWEAPRPASPWTRGAPLPWQSLRPLRRRAKKPSPRPREHGRGARMQLFLEEDHGLRYHVKLLLGLFDGIQRLSQTRRQAIQIQSKSICPADVDRSEY